MQGLRAGCVMPRVELENIELLCLDVDGVLTDGGIFVDDHGIETKRFHARDGLGLRVWMKLGYYVAIITGRKGMATAHRARELGIEHVIIGTQDKAAALEAVVSQLGLTVSETAVIGDDLPDLPMMSKAGYAMAVADAASEVRSAAAFVTTKPGGQGAVREAVEHLLKAKGRWDEAIGLYG